MPVISSCIGIRDRALQQVAQFAFEQEYVSRQDYRVTTDTFLQILPKLRPSLTDEIIEEFQKNSIIYSRT
jgi:transitional endoplasmic reticulum ATPase